jgi:hypothetical protein
MMVNSDGSIREIDDDNRYAISPYGLGKRDAQRYHPRLPLFDNPAEAAQYARGWRERDQHRPVPNVLHQRWRWLPVIRVWRQIRGR